MYVGTGGQHTEIYTKELCAKAFHVNAKEQTILKYRGLGDSDSVSCDEYLVERIAIASGERTHLHRVSGGVRGLFSIESGTALSSYIRVTMFMKPV